MYHPTLILVSSVLVIIGALNWGVIALQPDSKGLVESVFPNKNGKASNLARLVYGLVALSALLLVYVKFTTGKKGGSRSSSYLV